MAGEKKGKAFEALIAVALEDLRQQGVISDEIFWNKTPDGMSIEPDLVIGKDVNNPSSVFLVTHSIATPKSNIKLWRNIGELAEIKTRLASIPHAYNIVFGSGTRDDIAKLQASTFDGQLYINDRFYAKFVSSWVEQNYSSLPDKSTQKVDKIRILRNQSQELDEAIQGIADDLNGLIAISQSHLDGLWQMERARSITHIPTARTTFVRRGLAKLLCLPSNYIAKIIDGQRQFPYDGVLYPAITMGILVNTINGYRLNDAECITALMLLKPASIKAIFEKPFAPGLQAVIDQVINVALLDQMLATLSRRYKELISPEGMLQALQAQAANPAEGISPIGNHIPTDIWLFRLICECLKTSGSGSQSYGISQLVEDVRLASRETGLSEFVKKSTGNALWEFPPSAEPVRRGLQDWVNRIPNTSFSVAMQAVTSYVLSMRLATIPEVKVSEMKDELINTWRSSTFEARLLTHLEFDPLRELIATSLDNRQWKIEYMVSCFAEATLNKKSRLTGTTRVITASMTLINWQSAHGSHTNDKRKELCGRAVALRYAWDATTKQFVPRPGIKKLILVLDGTWRQQDLDTLVRAGWDHIFYADQMDALKQAIV